MCVSLTNKQLYYIKNMTVTSDTYIVLGAVLGIFSVFITPCVTIEFSDSDQTKSETKSNYNSDESTNVTVQSSKEKETEIDSSQKQYGETTMAGVMEILKTGYSKLMDAYSWRIIIPGEKSTTEDTDQNITHQSDLSFNKSNDSTKYYSLNEDLKYPLEKITRTTRVLNTENKYINDSTNDNNENHKQSKLSEMKNKEIFIPPPQTEDIIEEFENLTMNSMSISAMNHNISHVSCLEKGNDSENLPQLEFARAQWKPLEKDSAYASATPRDMRRFSSSLNTNDFKKIPSELTMERELIIGNNTFQELEYIAKNITIASATTENGSIINKGATTSTIIQQPALELECNEYLLPVPKKDRMKKRRENIAKNSVDTVHKVMDHINSSKINKSNNQKDCKYFGMRPSVINPIRKNRWKVYIPLADESIEECQLTENLVPDRITRKDSDIIINIKRPTNAHKKIFRKVKHFLSLKKNKCEKVECNQLIKDSSNKIEFSHS